MIPIYVAVMGALFIASGSLCAIFPIQASQILNRRRVRRAPLGTPGFTRFTGIWVAVGGMVAIVLDALGFFRR